MALKLGALYVSLTARTSGFSRSMAGAMKAVERFAKQTKKVASEVAQVSGVLAAVGGAAVKMASSVDGPTKTAMAGLEKSTQLLAVQVADMLLPAVREMAAMFRSAAGYVAGLDPEVKKHIANFAVLAAQLAFATKALSFFSGATSTVAGVMRAAWAIGLAPILGMVAAIALVAAAVAALHYAFRTNLGGIADAWKRFANWLSDTGASLFGGLGDFVTHWVDRFLGGLREISAGAAKLFKLMGQADAAKIAAGISRGYEAARQKLAYGGLKGLATQAVDLGKKAGEAFVAEFKRIGKELGLDRLLKGRGTPIALGRGMGAPREDAAPSMDTSSMGTMAWFGGMQAAAADGEGAMTAIAVKFSAAEISANEVAMAAMRQADSAKEAAAAAAAMDAAVGAANWGEALKVLDAGLGKAADFGQSLELWGKRMAGLIGSAGKQILGAVGDLVDSVVQGAQQGGVWGAVIAAFMEIAKKTASALKFLDVAMAFVGKIAEMVEPLVKPIFEALTNLLGGILSMIGPLFTALQPLFDAIGALLENLGPVLSAIGDLIQALAPIIEVIGKIVGKIVELLKPVFELIAGVIKVIATVILGIIIALNEIAAAFGDEAAKAESAKLKGIVDKMWAPGANELDAANRDAATATLLNAAAQDEAAKSAQKVAESLSNVPAGYRIANARYQADLGITSGNAWMAGDGGGAGVTINGDVVITSDAEETAAIIADAADDRAAERKRGQRTGNPRNNSGNGGRNG